MKETISRPGSSRRWKILLLVLSVPAFILLTEIIFTIVPVDTYFENRFFLVNRSLDYPEVFKKDHDLFWRMRSSQIIRSRFFENREYRIDAYGLRGGEVSPKSDKIRIIAMGNSCTFGWRIPDSLTFVKQLEQMLNGDSSIPEVETINAGIPGYSSFQGMRFFFSDIVPLKPDILLIMFAWNDQWAASDNIADKDQKQPPNYVIGIQNFFSQLKIYRITKKLLLSAVEEPLDAKLIKENPIYRVSLEDFYDNLNSIVQYCKENKITPILLTSPIPSLDKYYPPGRKSPMHVYHEYYNSQTRLLAKNSGVAVIDLAKIFDDYDNLFDDAPNDPIHFNAEGHRVAAAAIYEFIKENNPVSHDKQSDDMR